jgi:hypothetical protein
MPEAAVDKHGCPSRLEQKVRATDYIRTVETKSKTSGMKMTSKYQFWLGILATDASHHLRPFFSTHYVDHDVLPVISTRR